VAKDVLTYLSVIGHLDDFIKGVIDTSHVIFYLTLAFVGLFLTYRSLESMRWRS
jgi:ABC-2 type transport system permease protein